MIVVLLRIFYLIQKTLIIKLEENSHIIQSHNYLQFYIIILATEIELSKYSNIIVYLDIINYIKIGGHILANIKLRKRDIYLVFP